MTNKFSGFPRATLKFLKELQANNNRDWFNENKSRYEDDVLAPSLEFIAAMQSPLKKVAPHYVAIPRRTGGSLMRIYRDTRFAKDKTPYKTNIGIHFRHEMGKDVHAPGFYFHLDPKDAFFGAGIWHPESKDLRKIRDQIVDDGASWKRISRSKKLLAEFEFGGESLKRPPRDFDPEHSLIADLKRKDFILLCKLKKTEVFESGLVKRVSALIKLSSAYSRFLCDALRIPF